MTIGFVIELFKDPFKCYVNRSPIRSCALRNRLQSFLLCPNPSPPQHWKEAHPTTATDPSIVALYRSFYCTQAIVINEAEQPPTEEPPLAPIFGGDTTANRSTAPQNRETPKFPSDVPGEVQTAIRTYTPDPNSGNYRAQLQARNPSVITYWGVRLETMPKEHFPKDERPQLFIRLADERCRNNRTTIKITSKQTSSATTHLLSQHKIKSSRTIAAEEKAVEVKDELQSAKNSHFFQTNPQRYMALEYVKAFTIYSASPFSFAEQEPVRCFFSLMSNEFDVKCLHSRAVKTLMTEIYAATVKVFNASMQQTLRKADIPILYVNADLWTSKISGLKYIGVRVFFVDENLILKTYLLAVKLFRPHHSIEKHTGDVVLKWIQQVLAKHGVRERDVADAVTDSGADVRRGVASAYPWEWCIAHLLNRATIDGTGMSPTRGTSKNLGCRDLLESIKKMMEHFNKSATDETTVICRSSILEEIIEDMSDGKTSKVKLSQAVAQRWISICKMLLRVLERWDALKSFYVGKGELFPLNGKKDEVEVFNIVNAVKKVVVYTQSTSESSASGGLQRLVLLVTTTLECRKPLRVVHVQGVGQNKEDVAESVERPHTDLTKVAASTREVLANGFAQRFVAPRYGKGLGKHSHRYDMAMFLTLGGKKLKYINTLKNSTVGRLGGFTKSAEEVKKVILNKLRDLLIEEIKTSRARPNTTPVAVSQTEPAAKRLKTDVGTTADPLEAEFIEEGIMDSISDEETDNVGKPVTMSPEDDGDELMKEWNDQKAEMQMSGADYWRNPGRKRSAMLRSLAQAIFGAPSSAGVMERDFSVADMFQPCKRGSLDPACLEMALYLRGQLQNIPRDIPQLIDEEARQAIPSRFANSDMLEEVEVLDYAPEPENDAADEVMEDDLSWLDEDGGPVGN